MTQCIPQLTLPFHPELPVVVRFDAPEVSSDAGSLLLRQVDEKLGLSEGLAACLPDARDPARVVHDRREQTQQRILQIALGYEDCNDADRLRHDPLLNTACGRSANDPAGLSSQPTLSRFENGADGRALKRTSSFLENSYVRSLSPEQEVVILDLDGTDDETHGAQQLSFFHGYYDHYMYHPLLVYDGDTGELITAVLRPGNTHDSRGAKGVLRRLIRKIRKRCPNAAIVVRADSGFCAPKILNELERLNEKLGGVDYILGIAKNSVLLKRLKPTLDWAKELSKKKSKKVVRFTSFLYRARSWGRSRRVVAKAEHSLQGANPRFILTTLNEFPPDVLYRAYCGRGQCENWIKDLKNALMADRLSCCAYHANFFRLLLHAAAYRLMHALREQIGALSPQQGRLQFDTLRLRFLKVAAEVSQSTRRILVRLPKAFPQAQLFHDLAQRLSSIPVPS